MKTYVISLKNSAARRQAAAAQLDALDVDFEFFDAIRGDTAMHDCFEGYDEYQFLLNTGRCATLGEIGCFASHLALWRQCVSERRAIMILEDDFLLDPEFATAVRHVADNIAEYGFIRLQSETRARKRLQKSLGNFQLWRYLKTPHSTMCYGISPAVASNLISQCRVVEAPIDVFLKQFWEHGNPMFGLTPYTVTESVAASASTIEDREKVAKPLRIATLRAVRKGRWFLRRMKFNLRTTGRK